MTERTDLVAGEPEEAAGASVKNAALKALRAGTFDFALIAVEQGQVSIDELIEDLKIYQAELEVQNEELRQIQLRSETALRRFSNLFAALPLPAFVIDSLGVIHDCNINAERLFNLSHKQLRSHFFPRLVRKQDHVRLRRLVEEARDVGVAEASDIGMQASDGLTFVADLSLSLLPNDDEASCHLVVTVADQTEKIAQRQALESSQRRFTAYFDSAPIGMAAVTAEKRWQEVNRQLCELLGFSRSELLNTDCLQQTHPEDLAADQAQFARMLAGEMDDFSLEKRFIRKNGEIFQARMVVHCVRQAAGEVDYFVATIEDISSRKQAERSLLERDQVLKKQTLQLRERVKELTAIYAISRAIQQFNDVRAFMDEVLLLIPPGMLYPEDTEVCIQVGEQQYVSEHAGQMHEALSQTIYRDGVVAGRLQVGYKRAHERLDFGPFFKEEQAFVDGVAELIGRFLRRLHSDQARNLSLQRNSELLELTLNAPGMDDQKLLAYALEMAERLTGSRMTYAHFVNEDQATLSLGIWSGQTLQSCSVVHDNHYPLAQAGIWADCFHQRQTCVHNDYQALSAKQGLSDGHTELRRHMSVPVLSGSQVVLIMGVGNKVDPYDAGDSTVLEMIANNTWALLQQNRSQRKLKLDSLVFQFSREAVVITDAQKTILSVNDAFTRITGYDSSEAIGQTPNLLNSGQHDTAFFQQMWRQISDQGFWQGEIWNRRKNGEVYPQWLGISAATLPTGEVSEYIGVFMDISEHKEAQQRIEYLAHHDPLTGLPNRALLRDRFEQAMAHANRQGHRVGVVYLDLDHFKNINDTLGHRQGDELLIQVAQRLCKSVRESDTVSRLGGDEFLLVLNNVNSGENVAEICAKIQDVFALPFQIGLAHLTVTCSVGACLYPDDGDTFDFLMQMADIALYQAKAQGRDNYKFFTEEMNFKVRRRLQLEVEMRRAVLSEDFYLEYQPQYHGQSGRIVGVESLVRWRHAELGQISPAEFIPIAEDCGFIVELGHWIMHQACRQARLWYDEGCELRVAVNVSYAQFVRNNVLQLVIDSLRTHALPASCLELELTESILVADPENMLRVVGELKKLGVRFSIDDFGTGYSSLSYLKRFAVDRLKIDQSFVRDVPGDKDDESIVSAIINLAHSLQIECIAEGVETSAQRDFLVNLGCHQIQGYLLSRPMPAEAISQLVEADA